MPLAERRPVIAGHFIDAQSGKEAPRCHSWPAGGSKRNEVLRHTLTTNNGSIFTRNRPATDSLLDTDMLLASDCRSSQNCVPNWRKRLVNAISKTAFFCCGIRAEDAKSPGSICADIYADDFMTEEGRTIWAQFSGHPRRNISNVVRARIFQDEISTYLKRNKELQIVNIGAGFDSRAYRLAGGRWFEFDEPSIIEHKNSRVPADICPNPLQRIAVDFGAGELPVALRQCQPQADTLVVIEGVFMYLDKEQVRDLLDALCGYFPTHTLICDLMDKTFFDRHLGKMHDQILALGSEFKLREINPEQLFLDHGYTQEREPLSIVGQARDFKAVFVPDILLKTALRSLRDGYRVHTFRHHN